MIDKERRVCAIMQPTYLPWVGYFNLIKQADIFIILDNVQFSKQSWQVKNRINCQGKELTLTVPIKKAPIDSLINEIKIDSAKKWRKKHLKSIFYNYKKSSFFSEVYPIVEKWIMFNTDNLSELNEHIIREISQELFPNKKIIRSSTIDIHPSDKLDRIIKICKEVNANTYLSPVGALAYLESMNYKEVFNRSSIVFRAHEYQPKTYNQLHEPFTPYLSVIDLLFNEGFKGGREII